jgi:hypothetical protein
MFNWIASAAVTQVQTVQARIVTRKIIPPPPFFYFQNLAGEFNAGERNRPERIQNPHVIAGQRLVLPKAFNVRESAWVFPHGEIRPFKRSANIAGFPILFALFAKRAGNHEPNHLSPSVPSP